MTEDEPERPHLRWLVPAASLGIFLVTTVLGLAVLEASGVDVRRRVWLARTRLLGPEPVGIWQSDPRLGWRHVPGAVGRQREVPDYDVLYHIDTRGHRTTPGAASASGPAVIFLGGSFTFGHGVGDHSPFPAVLQRAWPDHRVINAATNGWGSAQALLVLRDLLAEEPDVALVVCGFIGHHVKRNHRSQLWLTRLDERRGRRNPYFDLVDGELVFRGLADPARDGLYDDRALFKREVRMTVSLLREMASTCEARDIPFVVVQLPEGRRNTATWVLTRAVGAEDVVDLDSALDYWKLRYRHDPHLTEAGHAAVAAQLRPVLEHRMRARP